MPLVVRFLRAVHGALVYRLAEAGFAIIFLFVFSVVFAFGVDQFLSLIGHSFWQSVNSVFLGAGVQVFFFYQTSNYLLIAIPSVFLAILLFPNQLLFLRLANILPLIAYAIITIIVPTMPSPFTWATDVIDNHKLAMDFVWVNISVCNFFVPSALLGKKKS